MHCDLPAGFVERMQAAKIGAKMHQIQGTSKFVSSFEYLCCINIYLCV